MQVAWPLRHPGVDRPASVSVSPFLLLHVFPLTLSFSPSIFISLSLLFFSSLSMSISQYIFICYPTSSLPPIHHFLPQGERCSFSVQMWFYFLCGLRSDLWAVLPAGMAKGVLGQVLSETLQLLVQRYARARPSYKRHLQIRYLSFTILTSVIHLRHTLCDKN